MIRSKIRGGRTNRIAGYEVEPIHHETCLDALDEESTKLIIEVHKEQNLGARRLEKIIEFKHENHIPHNAIHKELRPHGLANVNRNKSKRRKPWIRYERKHSLSMVHLD